MHWVVFNIPPETTEVVEGDTPLGTQGKTDFKNSKYGGPCPPSGVHRYFFKFYALDTTLDLDSTALKIEVEQAMIGHILAEAELIGLYSRNK